MNIEEIKKGAPEFASHYMEFNDKIYYLRFVVKSWKIHISYKDIGKWFHANQYAIKENMDKVKPL